jgi:hypothetical protein
MQQGTEKILPEVVNSPVAEKPQGMSRRELLRGFLGMAVGAMAFTGVPALSSGLIRPTLAQAQPNAIRNGRVLVLNVAGNEDIATVYIVEPAAEPGGMCGIGATTHTPGKEMGAVSIDDVDARSVPDV